MAAVRRRPRPAGQPQLPPRGIPQHIPTPILAWRNGRSSSSSVCTFVQAFWRDAAHACGSPPRTSRSRLSRANCLAHKNKKKQSPYCRVLCPGARMDLLDRISWGRCMSRCTGQEASSSPRLYLAPSVHPAPAHCPSGAHVLIVDPD